MIDFEGQTVIVTGAGRGLGRFGRVFVGLGDGWVADPGARPTADDVTAHLAQLTSTEPSIIPASIFDEVTRVCAQLGIG